VQLHDPDSFELRQAIQAFHKGESMLSEICSEMGVRPGPVYDEYVNSLRETKEVPASHKVRVEVRQHVGYDRIYNDLPVMANTISADYGEWYLYELADYEPLPDTEWVTFLVPKLGLVKLYTSLFYDLGCYVEVAFLNPKQKNQAAELATRASTALDGLYAKRARRDTSLSHG
jgi:hypothetical protein